MNSARAELEALQARQRELEGDLLRVDQLTMLADQLERELDLFEKALDRGERRALKLDDSGTAARVMGLGFALLFVTPIVAMIGISLSRAMRHEFELAMALLGAGLVVVTLTSWPRARRAIARRFSPGWRLARAGHAEVATLRAEP